MENHSWFARIDYSKSAVDSEGFDDTLLKFKVSQPGLRSDYASRGNRIILEHFGSSQAHYLSRKSYRSFEQDEVSTTEVSNLLNETFTPDLEVFPVKAFTLTTIGHLLSNLSQFKQCTSDLPKYLYASAGHLYPIQVYLQIGKNTIENIEAGYYYYDPVHHELVFARSFDISNSTLKIILVGNYSALEPVYGSFSEILMWLNAGYLLGALSQSQSGKHCFTWDGIDFSEDTSTYKECLNLPPNHEVLVTLEWGFSGQNLQKLLKPTKIQYFVKTNGSKYIESWQTFYNSETDRISDDAIFSKIELNEAPLEAASIIGESSIGLVFHVSSGNIPCDLKYARLRSGFWAHKIMLVGIKHGYGFCPMGNMSNIQLDDGSTPLHALFGGRVSQRQLLSKEPSNVKINTDHTALSNSILTFISTQLPKYMLPSRIIILPTWPLTDNGKLDSKSLEAIYLEHGALNDLGDLRVTPFNEFENVLMSLWQKVLGTMLPLNTDFFQTGGSSLDALKLALMINETFNLYINVAWVYQYQTITQQAKWLLDNASSSQNGESPRSDFITFNRMGSKRPIILVHPGRDSAFAYSTLSSDLGQDQPIIALEYYNLFQDSDLDETVEDMAARYVKTLLSLCHIEPPYILGGWSFGGLVAFEMSRQLNALGKSVKQIFMFDTSFPTWFDTIPDYVVPDDICEIINEPEKQLYETLSESLQQKYKKAAILELNAILSYRLVHPGDFGQMKIVQFLPEASKLEHYTGWNSFCSSLVIEPIPGDHGSILRNTDHRASLVKGIKRLTSPKLIFVFASSSFNSDKLSQLLPGHFVIALDEKNFTEFKDNFGTQFTKCIGVSPGVSIGYINGFDYEKCRLAIEASVLMKIFSLFPPTRAMSALRPNYDRRSPFRPGHGRRKV